MNRHCHPTYQRLVEQARQRHRQGRSPLGISAADIVLARLYCHAYRCHVIGAFHATRSALAALPAASSLAPALDLLHDLANLSMDPILPDARALLSTFYRYEDGIERTLTHLQQAEAAGAAGLTAITARFRASLEQISNCNGICLTRDTAAPEQASFVVPNLGITIVPLVYGDYHSWNLAWLPGERSDVPFHQHQEGVEIHLGYSPMRGHTVLGDCRAEVAEGYAMPIPPGTVHGYVNDSQHVHHVPFIYGSLRAGGWGVFLDVEAQQRPLEQLRPVSRESADMNGTVYLERAIEESATLAYSQRRVLIPAAATARGEVGGLELAVSRADRTGLSLESERFRAVSLVRGEGMLLMAGLEQPVQAHDHFGIPAGVPASLCQRGTHPLVFLDSVIR